MSGSVVFEVVIIFLLTLANGFFSASEMAIVSSRRSRLQQQADEGRRAARQALDLAEHSDRFLATVQIGITLISTFAAAFGGVKIGAALADWLASFPLLAPYAQPLGLGIVVALLTYFSLVLGELAPKRLALQHAERFATFVAPIMNGLARIARPVVAFLTASANLILRLLGQGRATRNPITQEDIVYLAREGTVTGTVEPGEAQFINRVFRFTDRPAHAIMTPRPEIVALEVGTPLPEVVTTFLTSRYSRIPVYEGTLDTAIGVVFAKDLLGLVASNQPLDMRQLAHPAIYVLEHQHIDDLLATFRRQGTHLALVVDEYGQVSGLLTMEDVLEELVGEIEDEFDLPEDRSIVQRADGSWLVDGRESYDRVREVVKLPEIPPEEQREYTTLAGFLLARLGHIPKVGERVPVDNFVLEVMDMDGRRIDRVLIQPKPVLGAGGSVVEASQA